MTRTQELVTGVAMLVAVTLIVVGLAMVSVPAALIAAGAVVLIAAAGWYRGGGEEA